MHSIYSRFSEDEAYGSSTTTPKENMSPENSDYEKFSSPPSASSDHFLLFDELSDLMMDQRSCTASPPLPADSVSASELEDILTGAASTARSSITSDCEGVMDLTPRFDSSAGGSPSSSGGGGGGGHDYARAMEADFESFFQPATDTHVRSSNSTDSQLDPVSGSVGGGGICLVCGDTSSGFHYGVASCEACKAFFKRTIQGNIEYRCLLNESCEVSKRRRKACQACRLQKCFRVGMLREGVRLDRVRGGRQKYARGFPNAYNTPFAYKKNFQEEENLINHLKSIQPQTYDKEISSNKTELMTSYDHLNVISALADTELVAMVTWAKQIPDFSKLSLNDQILLFHYSWNEILLLNFIHRSLPYNGRLHFSPSYTITKSEWANTQIEDLMCVISDVVKIFEINLCKLSHEEYLLLKTLVICNTEGLSKIQGISNISKLRKNLLDCLHHVTITQKSSDPYRVSKILLCLPYLRQLDIESRNFWNKIKKEGKVTLRKLFVEMLEAF